MNESNVIETTDEVRAAMCRASAAMIRRSESVDAAVAHLLRVADMLDMRGIETATEKGISHE